MRSPLHITCVVCLVLLSLVLETRAQHLIDIVADVVQFRGDGARTRWEFQYSFADTAVRYVIAPEGFVGELHCSLEVVSATLGDTTRDEWISTVQSKDAKTTNLKFYSGVRNMMLTPGTYNVHFRAVDLNDPSAVTTSSFSSTVRAFSLRPAMSDMMFVMPLVGGTNANFMRNGQAAIPNPRHEIVGRDPSIGVYAEIYNGLRSKVDTFALEFQVLNNIREEQLTTYLPVLGGSNGVVVREEIPVGALRSGVYALRTRLLSRDLLTTYETGEERFYVLNPELPPEGRIFLTEDEAFQTSEWAVTTGDRLELELELTNILASNAEKTIREQCTEERAKQRFLFRFWGSRDTDPSTAANERLDDFRKMYKRAQAFYTNPSFREGWKTDRGMILLGYGIPNQIEQFIQTMDAKPYEIWFYSDIQGGVYFYFVDWQLQQNHRLVHSTMIGNVKEPNWYKLYAKAFSPDPNPVKNSLPNQR